jgi:hypothetical protein
MSAKRPFDWLGGWEITVSPAGTAFGTGGLPFGEILSVSWAAAPVANNPQHNVKASQRLP